MCANMASKTDELLPGKRDRIKTGCPPNVEALFFYVNLFPHPDQMKDLGLPLQPMPPFYLIGVDRETYEKSEEYKKKEEEYQGAFFEVASKMHEDLKTNGFVGAAAFLANKNDWAELVRLVSEWVAADEVARDLYEKAKGGIVTTTRNEILSKFKACTDAKQHFFKRRMSLAHKWTDTYYRIRAIKRLLLKLAFVGRNFDNAERRLKNAGFLNLDQLIPDLYVDEDGILHKQEDPVLEVILGLDVRRIRQCKICSNFFWAKRKDRQCCQEKCANVHNQRKSRENKEVAGLLYKEANRKRRLKLSSVPSQVNTGELGGAT